MSENEDIFVHRIQDILVTTPLQLTKKKKYSFNSLHLLRFGMVCFLFVVQY